ncbi:BQ5605_C025g10013 [Microbotryum silenes-dioicae]|uniref:BQ5605_C025g10013 protein n=1 Tax=Microbotryum silenes-dioicae TaxID=796604 RepID=A0A2X0MQG4_9BASI|nr:BQ5605_C025g10013 [Microbotryum silenes-dioicae]
MAAFGGMYFVGGMKILYSTGIYSGGPPALWSSWIVTMFGACATAACLAEICSSIPLSGSIYLWAAAVSGPTSPNRARIFGFIGAWWTSSAWISFCASTSQAVANFIMSELVVFNRAFPGGLDNSNIKFRAVQWAIAEFVLFVCVLSNTMPPKRFKWIFRASLLVMVIDFLALFIALPIGAAKTYGFRGREFLTTSYNGTGASSGWNWTLSFLSTSYVLTGFDAAAHIGEEVKNPSLAAARGVFYSCLVSAIFGAPLLMLLLVCSPPLDVLFEAAAPQPLVVLFQDILGTGGQLVLSIISIIGLMVNVSVCLVAASRLISAIARDGILPGSAWIGRVDKNGNPTNAVYFVGGVGAVLLCTILPSTVAFTSLVSISGVPTIALYAAIPVLRLLFTRDQFKHARWSNGRLSTPLCIIAAIWNLFICSIMFSPYTFPVTAQTFNFAAPVFVGITICGIISWWIVPEERWLSKEFIQAAGHSRVLEDSSVYSSDKAE